MMKTLIKLYMGFLLMTPNVFAAYLDCTVNGGPVYKAQFLINSNDMGGSLFSSEDGPLSYLNGRDQEHVGLFLQSDESSFIIKMSSDDASIPSSIAYFKPEANSQRFLELTLYFAKEGHVTLHTGSCIMLGAF